MDTITGLATDERSARILLTTISEPGDARTGTLLRRLGGVETLRLLDTETIAPGLDEATTEVWRSQLNARADLPAARNSLDSLDAGRITVLVPGDDDWPAGFAELADQAPYALWVDGESSIMSRPTDDFVTISGARAATSYGEHVASMLASDLAAHSRVVVAGAAYGIDGAVHRAALASDGATVAVLASGVDRPYPSGHRDLIERIAQRGAVVSEIPPGGSPTRWRFVQRSRLLAAMSSATVIVEAGVRSGSLGVAEQARNLQRPVGAVPGPITSVTSAGPLRLIRDHGATVITGGEDVLALTNRSHSVGGQGLDAQHPGVQRGQSALPPARGLGL
ncbi:DNA-processing protein DprA [Pseudarthrobacter sp. J1738]|uniref:DNA-processing protein DprA n=1 Tax=Micrococcales TaxID=85006 RepID=UPI003B79CABD